MATPSQDPQQRRSGGLGSWWWIVVLVAIGLIVWWGGWGRGPATSQRNRGAAAVHGTVPEPAASAGQPSPKSGVTDQAANTAHAPANPQR